MHFLNTNKKKKGRKEAGEGRRQTEKRGVKIEKEKRGGGNMVHLQAGQFSTQNRT